MSNKKQPVNGMLCKSLTLEEAKNLKHGNTVYFRRENDSRGELRKVRVNGQVKRWKKEPDRLEVPWKYALNGYGYITHNNLEEWTLEDIPFARFRDVRVCPATGQEWMLVEYTWSFLSENQLLGHDDLNELIIELTNETIRMSTEANPSHFQLSYELYEVLPSRMQKFAPEGYYYGCHEADGEWGYWPVQEEE